MGDGKPTKKWEKIKKKVKKKYSIAKQKWEDIKAELQEDTNFYHSTNSSENYKQSPISNQDNKIIPRKRCPYCNTIIPLELLNEINTKSNVICENCGMEIT